MPYAVILLIVVSAIWSISRPALADAKARILLLYPYNETFPASTQAGDAARQRLSEHFGNNVDVYSFFLDLARFPDESHKRQAADYLAAKYKQSQPDLIIALGQSTLEFTLNYRSAFGADKPIVYCCVAASSAKALEPTPKVFGVVSDFDAGKTMDLALRLQPTARNLVVVSGSSELDHRWMQHAQAALTPYEARLNTAYLVGLPPPELLLRVSEVNRDTIILMLAYFMDNTGESFVPKEIAAEVARAAAAPSYSIFGTMLGDGIVGGYMDTFESAGRLAADVSLRVLASTDQSNVPALTTTDHGYRVDARQLERWALLRSALPAGTTVSFEASTLWDSHREAVLGALAIFGAAILALTILLAQIGRRRKAETYLKDSEERLNFAAASGGIGLWQYDIGKSELWSSEHCRTMFGLPPDCPLTTDVLLRRVHPADRHVASASIRAATYGLLAETMIEFRIVRPDGQVRWIQGRGHSTFDGHGNAIRVSGIFRDLTAYRAAQREAKDLSQRILSIQDEERQRIAQELHDSTAQHLAAINLNLMALRGASNPAEKTVPLFADIQGSLIAAMNELRTFTYLLYPQEISRDGLLETLGRYIAGFSRRTGLQVKLRITENLEDLSPTIQHSLMRIVQESLANVHRHASASRVTIKLLRSANRVHLLIADNGVGLKHSPTMGDEENSALPLGVGIPGMAARARQLGGKLDVRSKPTGTLVHAVLPLDLAHEVAVLRTVAIDPQNGVRRVAEHRASGGSAGTASTDATKARRWAKAQQQQHQH